MQRRPLSPAQIEAMAHSRRVGLPPKTAGGQKQAWNVPKPDTVCCLCGEPLSHWDPDEQHANYERKWNVHFKCFQLAERRLDKEAR